MVNGPAKIKPPNQNGQNHNAPTDLLGYLCEIGWDFGRYAKER